MGFPAARPRVPDHRLRLRAERALVIAFDLRRFDVVGAVLVAVWGALAWSIGDSLGLYEPQTLIGVCCATAALIVFVALATASASASIPMVSAGLMFAALAEAIVPRWTFVASADVSAARRLLQAFALVAIPLAIWPRTRRFVAPLAVATGVLAGCAVTAAAVRPQIDVWYILQQSATGLLHGHDMYRDHWIGSPGGNQGYPYMPWTSVVLAPFGELFGDVRYGLVCAMAAGAVIVHRLAGRDTAASAMLATLVFAVPGGLMLTESAWTEPLLLVYLAGCILATASGRFTLAVGCLALAVATKQYAWIVIPLFAAWRPFGIKRAAIAVLGGVGISLPWIIASPTAFFNGVLVHVYGLPAADDSLTLSGLLAHYHKTMPFAVVVIAVVAALGLALRYTTRTGNVAVACAAVLLVFDLFNHHSSFNQYWLVAEMLVVGMALAAGQGGRTPVSVTSPGTPARTRPGAPKPTVALGVSIDGAPAVEQ